MIVLRLGGLFLALVLFAAPAAGQTYLDRIGYTALQIRLGAATPTGAGVQVMQVEASVSTSETIYAPDPAVAAGRTGFTLNFLSTPAPPPYSGHATGVAQIFFGNGGMATGVTRVDAYLADHWIGDGFLGTGTAALPPITNIPKVSNHSYIGTLDNQVTDEQAIARADYLVDRGNHIMVVGVGSNTAGSGVPPIFGSGYNSIAVGRTDGVHGSGLTTVAGVGRVKPDLVAPQTSVSAASPTVAAAATLLVEAAGSTAVVRPQVIKSILMAGATKVQFDGTWAHTQTQPLDPRFGAGQLDIDRSHQILTAGPQPASNTTTVTPTGWDFNAVNSAGTVSRDYFFDIAAGDVGKSVSAVLTWHRQVSDSIVASPLANLDLRVHNASGFALGTVIDQSVSTVDNVEHVWLPAGLTPGRYAFRVELAGTGEAEFAFAWQTAFAPVPEPGAVLVFAAAVAGLRSGIRNRFRSIPAPIRPNDG